jgi:predicted nucleotidyltransferase component of viral defense system
LVFRGGTCLKKCYVDTHRFSEDLDFAIFEGSGVSLDLLKGSLPSVLHEAKTASGIDFMAREPVFEQSPGRLAIHIKVYFTGPRRTPTPISIKLDIEIEELLARPPVLRTIGHPYSDNLPPVNTVYCYGMEELFAEKLRALGDRYRPRDLYDSVYLFRRSDIHTEASLVLEVLEEKCAARGLPLPSLERLRSTECSNELREHWKHMLGHQLGQLPGFEDHFGQLEGLFAWLNGTPLPAEALQPIAPDEEWSPPPIEWRRGDQDRLEPVRFAAVNRLCIDLGYGGSNRIVEPYSLRHTRAGNILLYAIRSDNRELRAYRIDRIQTIAVTAHNFAPVFRVEFSPEGRLSVPLAVRVPRRASFGRRSTHRRTRIGSSSTVYIIQCTYCSRVFRRGQYSLTLKHHKDPSSGLPCPSTIGAHIDTEW